jgi:hypothetical protein
MNFQKSLIILLLLSLNVIISGCSDESNGPFELPENVHLKNHGLFDPFLADHLLESPLKQPFFWDDSLVTLCRIKKLEIVRKGNKKPDDIAERFEYLFDLSGRTTSFYFYNFEITDKIYSEVRFKYSNNSLQRLDTPVFLGKNMSQWLEIDENDTLTLLLRKKSGKEGDTTFIYHSKGIVQARIEKLGTFVSKVQFYLPSNKPISVLRGFLSRCRITHDEFLLAEKTVTFTDNNIPQRSFYLSENFVKGDLTEEWKYGNFGELSAYKKYINNTCVKDITFTYSKDKLLRSFENNRLVYEINYQ